MTITFHNDWLDSWERRVWQPNNGRWAPYSEIDELRIMQYIIDVDLGVDAEQRDFEQSQKQLDQALSNTRLKGPYRASHINQAILTAHRTRVEREGARYRLEYQRSR